jgi:3-hydroxyisobutyrate dehydrogenase-like beta-hydroxyacid dehydrogenase
MGRRIAARLAAAGHEVHAHGSAPEQAIRPAGDGLLLYARPQDAASRAEVLFTLVPDTETLLELAEGPHGILSGLRPGAVWVDLSTVDLAQSRQLAERVEALGARMLDAPISGSPSAAETGSLTMLVAGDERSYERVLSVLRQIASPIRYVGGSGDALAMKLAVNISLALQTLAFGEGVRLAESSGIEPDVAVDALLSSAAGSPMLRTFGPLLLDRPEEPWYTIEEMQKDLWLALEHGRHLEVPLPTTALANQIFSIARARGRRDDDIVAVVDVLAELAGRRRGRPAEGHLDGEDFYEAADGC